MSEPRRNAVHLLDDDGRTVLANLAYDAWGQLISGSNPTPYGYKGQWGYYTDVESGILLLTHRYLDPATGRFLTRDPIGAEGGVNLYAYVGNGVVRQSDAPGLAPTFKKCSKQQEQELRKHLQDVCGNRIGRIPSKSLRKCLKKRCEDIVITCADETDSKCREGRGWVLCAYTPPPVPRRSIVICPAGWDRSQCRPCLGQLILHEMVHSCGYTDELLPFACEEWGYNEPGAPPCPK